MVLKKTRYRFIFVNIVVAVMLMCISAYSTEASSDAASILNAYKSENSVTRRMALSSLSDVAQNTSASEWVVNLLTTALDDKSPVVVSVAVEKIGRFNLTGLSNNLITLYHDVDQKYSNAYADRVRFSIVPALGKLGGDGVANLLKKLLSEDNGSVMGEYLLSAIKDLNDASLIGSVNEYRVKMDKMIRIGKTENYNPLIYSRMQIYVDFALNVEKSLLKGGK